MGMEVWLAPREINAPLTTDVARETLLSSVLQARRQGIGFVPSNL